jgi:hypothetical protein
MTAKKTIAESLLFMLTHPVAVAILNRENSIDRAIDEVESWWGYDLFKRKPGRAYYDEQGNFHTTDLDLACFMYELSRRGAVINIPRYKSMRANVQREDQQLASKYNRHGKIIGLNSNKDFFSFSIKVIDENVIGEDQVGDFRNFALTDLTGEWYKGWHRIEFSPTLKENRWLHEKELFTGNTIYFKNFIAPNRWTSFFGHHYALTKMLLDRLEDESKFYASEIKRLQAEGITFPKGEGPREFVPYTKEKGVRKSFTAFEVRVQYPEIEGKYSKSDSTQEMLVELYNRRKYFVYTLAPRLRFMTRAAEYAHFKNANRMPFWIQNNKWQSGYKLPRGRIEWDRLVLFQPEPGKPAVSLLKRQYEKSTEVAAD